jgi:protein SCO1/2
MVLNFVFTNCYYVCAGLTLHLREVVRVARDALGDERFSVLSIGFDAAHDNPASMREFARARGIDDPDWRFASADAATIRRLTDAAGFSWAPSSAGFDHVTQVTLVDANGRILQQVYGPDFAPPALVEPLKSLVLDQSFDRSMARGLIDSVKLFCSAYDPASGRYRFDFGMFAGSAPALLVFGMAALAILFLSRKTR